MESVGQQTTGTDGSKAMAAPLQELAAQEATGVLVVKDANGEEAQVWLRDGYVYAVSVPGRRPLLGVRLVSSGVITPEALAEALQAQRTELAGWRLGELLVHLGFVERPVIDEFVTEQMNDQFADLLGWDVHSTTFRNGEHTRSDMTLPHHVSELLTEAAARRMRWDAVLERIGGPDTVPDLESTAATQSELGPHEWAMLCKVDGRRSVSALADECGFTLYEAARLIADLQEAALVSLPGRVFTPPAVDEAPLAKVLQLHPSARPAADDGAPAPPARPQHEGTGLVQQQPDRADAGASENWARMAEAASMLSELAGDTGSRDLLDMEEIAESDDSGGADSLAEFAVPAPVSAVDEPQAPRADEASVEVAEPSVPQAIPIEELEEDVEDYDEDDDPAEPESPPAESAGEFTDTASLLRELSSLGVNEEGSGARLSSQRPSPGGEKGKRRRGFLGR